MIPYTEKEVGIGYIGDKIITVGFWSFSMRVFITHSKGNQRNWHNLGIRGRMLGAVDKSEKQECRHWAWVV